MKVKLLSSVGINGKFYGTGDVVDVNNILAQDLVYRNKAEIYVPAQEPQEEPKVEEQEESSQEEEEIENKGDVPEEGPEIEEQGESELKVEPGQGYSFEQLKEMAAELGIKFPANISAATLQDKIERQLAEQG